MRNPAGYGTIKKLSGKRRRPYAVAITTKYEMTSGRKDVSFLKDYIDAELYDEVVRQYTAACPDMPKAKQTQTIIGYYETRQQAMIALAEYNKNPFDIQKSKVTFKQIYDILYESEFQLMRESAERSYRTAFTKCKPLYDMRMRDIKLAHLQAAIDDYKEFSKQSQKAMITLMRAMYAYCARNDIIEKDYSQYLKVTSQVEKQVKLPFSVVEIQTCWNQLDWMHGLGTKHLIDVPCVDTLIIMIYSGIRIAELLNVKKEDVHLKERWIYVEGTKTKAAKRIVPIHKKIVPLLKARLDADNDSIWLIPEATGNQLDYSRYRSIFLDHFKKAFGIEKTAHSCRHTFISIAAASDMNPILVKKIVGHATTDVTEGIYTHSYIASLINEIDKFDLSKVTESNNDTKMLLD